MNTIDLFQDPPKMEKSAVLSPCRAYRYELWRRWHEDSFEMEEREGNNSAKYAMFIGLNPSTADETKDDPTIRKCVGFAKRWGYGALCMTNLFALRETNPAWMKKCPHPIGQDNNDHLGRTAASAGIVIAAWGKDGAHWKRDEDVCAMMKDLGIKLHALRLNGDGSPGHPLYIPYSAQPVLWEP